MATFKVGDRVKAVWSDGETYKADVIKVDGKKVTVKFLEDNVRYTTSEGNVTAIGKPGRPSTKKEEAPVKKKKDVDVDDFDEADSAAGEDDDDEKDDSEESDDEKTDFDDMTRAELKAYIAEKELDIKVTKDMEDSDIVEAIKEAEGESDDEAEESSDDNDEEREKGDDAEESSDDDDNEEKGKGKWFAEGDAEDDTFVTKRGAFRFWMKQGEKKMITIVSKKPLTFREHKVKINGRWSPFTCIAGTGERCPLCEAKKTAGLVKAFFIIDHTEFETKKGEKKKDQLRLMVMPSGAYQQLKDTAVEYFEGQDDFTYRGLKVLAKRSNKDKSPGVGDIFIVKGKNKIPPEIEKEASTNHLAKEVAPLSRKALATQVNFIEDDEAGE